MSAEEFPGDFGPDRLFRRGEQLVIESPADMSEWQIGEKRKTAVLIRDEFWSLAGRESVGDGLTRYILDPWPEYLNQIPGRRIRYDASYVKARHEAEKVSKQREHLGGIAEHFRILTGFLPSGVKSAMEEKCGISARNSTFVSIMLEVFLFFAVGALAMILSFGSMFEMAEAPGSTPPLLGSVEIFILLTLVLMIDIPVRFGSYWRGDQSPWGFCEWMIPRRRR